MEVRYHREMKQNYLTITAEEGTEPNYEIRMLAGNTIEGLLRFRIRKTDGRCQFCYEITSRQPLGRLLDTRTLGAEQIRNLLLGIAKTLAEMENYLLEEGRIWLDPEFIYVDPETFRPALCLVPGREGDFPREFSGFLQYLLGKVDHQDKEAVILAYGLYRESLKDNYGLERLLPSLLRELAPEEPEKEDAGEEGPEPDSRPAADSRSEPLASAEPENGRAVLTGHRGFLAKTMLLLAGEAAALWLWRGTEGLLAAGPWVLALTAAGAGAVLAAGWRKKKRGSEKKTWQPEEERWQLLFQPEEGNDTEEKPAEREPAAEPADEKAGPAQEADSHTVLLWSRTEEETRSLVSLDRREASIDLAYFPFLIGKQENLSDYVLSRNTVSRLHVRIDQEEDRYYLTDLNSTNGTWVNGRKLEANERTELAAGDEVSIAELKFRFR